MNRIELRKELWLINQIKDPEARALEMKFRANLIAQTVTPEEAEELMKYGDLIEILDYVWTIGTSKRMIKNSKKSTDSNVSVL